MDKKGLCCTCVSDKNCSFPRKFPVVQCEEFNYCGAKRSGTVKKSAKR